MPHSLILNLLHLSPISPNYLSGRHLHALFLTLVSHVDQELGNALHGCQSHKAFTLSPLQISRDKRLQWNFKNPIPANTPCWWRISLLDEQLFGKLTKLWLNLNPNHPWHLGPSDLLITSILGTPQSTQPWANASTYSQLYSHASEVERSINFELATPTAFRQSQYDTALPTRELVFNSLLNRWNQYSGIEIPTISLESVFPSFFDIQTQMIADSRSKFIGCIGDINYRILGDVEPLDIKHINVLADFALYCGAGRKTPMGMGMVRRIQKPS
jgi:CRISPR-associated endoribonuclease Cas6